MKIVEKAKFKTQIEALENAVPHRTVDVDLTTMKKSNPIDVRYENSMMIMQAEGDQSGMWTAEKFSAPLVVKLRAKTDSTNIRLCYNNAEIVFNWECNYDEIQVDYMTGCIEKGGSHTLTEYGDGYNGRIPENEFVDIEWFISPEIMIIKANGELRWVGDDAEFLGKVASPTQPEPVRVNPAWGSVVTVESLSVSEV